MATCPTEPANGGTFGRVGIGTLRPMRADIRCRTGENLYRPDFVSFILRTSPGLRATAIVTGVILCVGTLIVAVGLIVASDLSQK